MSSMEETEAKGAIYKEDHPNLGKKRTTSSPSSCSQFPATCLQDNDCKDKVMKLKDKTPAAPSADPEMKMKYIDYNPYGSPEFQNLRKQIFEVFQQDPHYNPLSIYSSSCLREEVKSLLDARFVKITQRLFDSAGDENLEFLTDEVKSSIRAELKDLKAHGYNVKPLEERVVLIARTGTLAKEGYKWDEKVKQSEVLIGDEMLRLENAKAEVQRIQFWISKLKRDTEVYKANQVRVKTEYATLKSKVDKEYLSNIMKNVY